MTLTITLRPEAEDRIRREANQFGLSPEEIAARRVEEAEELEKIANWIDPDIWRQYCTLFVARREGLTEKQRQDFVRLNDLVETYHIERLEHILQIAQGRGITLQEALQQLKIKLPLI